MNFNEWLESEGLGLMAEVFAANHIDEVEILADLNDAELESLGIPIGARKKIRRALARLGYEVEDTQALSPQMAVPETAPSPPESLSPDQQPAWSEETAQEAEPQPASGAPVAPAQAAAFPTEAFASPPQEQASQPQATHHQPKAKNSRKATAIMVAVGVHVAIILIATTLTIFAASKDEPEIIAAIAPPSTTPQQEMKKKTVQKQVKRAPSAASAAAAPMAQMMKANAEARFTTPEVTRTSTGPLGVGEGDLGTGAFGVGSGLGDAGDGGAFMGSKVQGNLAVVFDITKSMYSANPIVIAEIKRAFQDAHVVCVYGAQFTDQPAKFVRYKSNEEVLAQVKSASEKIGAVAVGKAMNEALFSLRRCDSLARTRQFALQSLGTAIENLLNQDNRPGTIFVFSDFKDGVEPAYMNKVQELVKQHKTKIVFWNPGRWQKGQREDRALYEAFAKATRGEVKAGGLKSE